MQVISVLVCNAGTAMWGSQPPTMDRCVVAPWRFRCGEHGMGI